jgi:predicted nucleic acid-binding protein
MKVVVADTSPLNYLVLIGEIQILPTLYREVLIPARVAAELEDSNAPPDVLKWVQSRPPWLRVRQDRVTHEDPELRELDPGERSAILLAQTESNVLLLIDDAAGRTVAERL